MPVGRPALTRGIYNFEDATLDVPAEVVLDTSFVIAALNASEPAHQQAVNYLQRLTDEQSVLIYNRLLEVELVEVAFKLAVKERHGRRGWPHKRSDGRVRRRAGRLAQELRDSWIQVVDTRPSLRIELEEVSDDVLHAMRDWGLASYDAIHALTAIYAEAPAIVTLDTGFADVPAAHLDVYVNSTRVPDCRRQRGGTGR